MTTKENVKTDPLAAVFAADDAHEALRVEYEAVSETAEGTPPEYLQTMGAAVVGLQTATDSPEFPIEALPLVPLAIAAGHKIYSAFVNGGKAGKFVPGESTWFGSVNSFRKALPRFSQEAITRPRHVESVQELIKQSVGPAQIALITGLSQIIIQAEIAKPGSQVFPEPAAYPAVKESTATDTNASLAYLELLGELRIVARLLRSVGCVS